MIQPVMAIPAPPMAAMPVAYEYCVIDIETTNGRPESAERWMRVMWVPNPTWTDATIGKRYHEMHARKLERLALLDGAPILSVALRAVDAAGNRELRCLQCMRAEAPRELGGGLVEGFADAAGMLTALRGLLDARVAPETVMGGHNIVHFDFPKLRFAYMKAGLRAPRCLADRNQPVFDTMREFSRFTLDERPFVALDDVLEVFGLESHKGAMSGKQVPELHAAGEYETILQYALLDVLAEADLLERMTGLHDGLG